MNCCLRIWANLRLGLLRSGSVPEGKKVLQIWPLSKVDMCKRNNRMETVGVDQKESACAGDEWDSLIQEITQVLNSVASDQVIEHIFVSFRWNMTLGVRTTNNSTLILGVNSCTGRK